MWYSQASTVSSDLALANNTSSDVTASTSYKIDNVKEDNNNSKSDLQHNNQNTNDNCTKINSVGRSSLGSCGDDSGVVNNMSNETTITSSSSSSSNTPPTVYRSPTSADNSSLYSSTSTYPTFNPYYYAQNYGPYGVMPGMFA